MTKAVILRRWHRVLWEKRFYWEHRGEPHLRLTAALASQKEITTRGTGQSFYFRGIRQRVVHEHARLYGKVPDVLYRTRLPKTVLELALDPVYQKWMRIPQLPTKWRRSHA